MAKKNLLNGNEKSVPQNIAKASEMLRIGGFPLMPKELIEDVEKYEKIVRNKHGLNMNQAENLMRTVHNMVLTAIIENTQYRFNEEILRDYVQNLSCVINGSEIKINKYANILFGDHTTTVDLFRKKCDAFVDYCKKMDERCLEDEIFVSYNIALKALKNNETLKEHLVAFINKRTSTI